MKSTAFIAFTIAILLHLSATGLQAQSDLRLYIFLAEECPISIYMTAPLSDIVDRHDDQVKFIAVFPMRNSTEATAVQFTREHGLENFSVMLDRDQAISRKFGATVTPEAIVVNANEEVLYRGRITDAYFSPGKKRHRVVKRDLSEALAIIMNGNTVSRPWPEAIGCFITFHEGSR